MSATVAHGDDRPAADGLPPLGWLGIVRLGLVQTALGAIVVMATSTMNRVMVVELMLPAVLPGALVAYHYILQTLRPRLGHGSDQGGRRTPWIMGGMAALAAGDILAVFGVATIQQAFPLGLALAVAGFTLIGVGAGSAGTSLLVLIAKRVAPQRRAAAAAIVWSMMIAGFAVTALTVGHVLDPFSTARLVEVVSTVAGGAFLVSILAVWGVEGRAPRAAPAAEALGEGSGEGSGAGSSEDAGRASFFEALRQVWAEFRDDSCILQFLSPKVIRNRAEALQVTQEYKDRLWDVVDEIEATKGMRAPTRAELYREKRLRSRATTAEKPRMGLLPNREPWDE